LCACAVQCGACFRWRAPAATSLLLNPSFACSAWVYAGCWRHTLRSRLAISDGRSAANSYIPRSAQLQCLAAPPLRGIPPWAASFPIWRPTHAAAARLSTAHPYRLPLGQGWRARSSPAASDISSFFGCLRTVCHCQLPACAALGRPHIASPCHPIFLRSPIPHPTRPPHPTFRNPAWRIRTSSSSQDSSPLPIPRRTRTLHPRCSPRTRILRLKALRAMSLIEARRKAQTCRCRHSTCLQYACRMDSNSSRRPNHSNHNSPWAPHSHHRRTLCHSTTLIRRIPMRRLASSR
jgi:hypothetical protein